MVQNATFLGSLLNQFQQAIVQISVLVVWAQPLEILADKLHSKYEA